MSGSEESRQISIEVLVSYRSLIGKNWISGNLDVLIVVGGAVIELGQQALLTVLTLVGKLAQSVGVDALDLLADWSLCQLGVARPKRCASSPHCSSGCSSSSYVLRVAGNSIQSSQYGG